MHVIVLIQLIKVVVMLNPMQLSFVQYNLVLHIWTNFIIVLRMASKREKEGKHFPTIVLGAVMRWVDYFNNCQESPRHFYVNGRKK